MLVLVLVVFVFAFSSNITGIAILDFFTRSNTQVTQTQQSEQITNVAKQTSATVASNVSSDLLSDNIDYAPKSFGNYQGKPIDNGCRVLFFNKNDSVNFYNSGYEYCQSKGYNICVNMYVTQSRGFSYVVDCKNQIKCENVYGSLAFSIGDSKFLFGKTIKLEGVGDNSALFTVDGLSDSIDVMDRETVNGIIIYVVSTFNSDDDKNDKAIIYLIDSPEAQKNCYIPETNVDYDYTGLGAGDLKINCCKIGFQPPPKEPNVPARRF